MKHALYILVLMLAAASAHAATPPATPIDISADSLEVLQEKQQATFRGNVIATQGDMRLRAETMTVKYRSKGEAQPSDAAGMAGAIESIRARGKVFLSTPTETAQGDEGIYALDSKTLHLTGNVSLTRGKNIIKGQKLEYSLATGKSTILAAPGDGGKPARVRALFVPEKGANLPFGSDDKKREEPQ